MVETLMRGSARNWIRFHHPYKPLSRPTKEGSRKGGALRAVFGGLAPLIASAVDSGSLRNFAYANPAWAGSAVHNSLAMARGGTAVGLKRRRGRRRVKRRPKFNSRKRYRRNKVCRPVIRRWCTQFDGSYTGASAFTNVLAPEGGVYKIALNAGLLPQKAFSTQYGQEFTHFKILRWIVTYVPETKAHPTLDEVAANDQRSLPTMVKSYHIGTVVPVSISNLLASQGAKPMDPQRVHFFSYEPKYVRKVDSAVTLESRPKNIWLPINGQQPTELTCLNGPIFAWSIYKVPNQPPSKKYMLRFKLHCRAVIKLASFKSFSGGKISNANFVQPKKVRAQGGVLVE